MKTHKKMNNEQRIAAWATVTNPVEALQELREHSEFLGSDPYYSDQNDALWDMVDRVLKETRIVQNSTPPDS
tara:strand:+ start:248 stop:463 length:216 start_codon:yes stop_codon:yes gene_type:complete